MGIAGYARILERLGKHEEAAQMMAKRFPNQVKIQEKTSSNNHKIIINKNQNYNITLIKSFTIKLIYIWKDKT